MAGREKVQVLGGCLREQQDLARREHYWQVHRRDRTHVRPQETHVLQLVTLARAWLLTEDGPYDEDTEAAVQHDLLLGGYGLNIFEVPLYLEVHHGELGLMWKQCRDNVSFLFIELFKVKFLIIFKN